ncbi:MAG TPA: GtrA family protein [Chlamydiales bacterium]|nr:GtrA family protein [Chlamydiales bacterium]
MSPFKTVVLQFVLYSFVGAVACSVDVLFFLLFSQKISLVYATSGSFVVATLVNYFLCLKFIFTQSQSHLFYQIVRTFIVASIGLLFNTFFFWLLIQFTDIPPIWVKLVVIPVVMIWNFLGRRTFVYSQEIPVGTLMKIDRWVGGRLLEKKN